MSDKEQRLIFSKNLKYYLNKFCKTQADITSDLGINKSTISTWCNGTKMPRMGTIQILANYFGIKKSDLIEEKTEDLQPQEFNNFINLLNEIGYNIGFLDNEKKYYIKNDKDTIYISSEELKMLIRSTASFIKTTIADLFNEQKN